MDTITKSRRSWNMSQIRSKHTSPEMSVRKKLTALGARYRLHPEDVPGRPDIAIKKTKIAIFVNGCFWHQHKNCSRSTLPKTNIDYWHNKLQRNVERQAEVKKQLQKNNWSVITIWECETKQDKRLDIKLKKVFA